ncbi:hypothetical protein BOTBODRAFT_135180 [Botryobasidium botryosum FD-172 SS1]|uniref:diphthine methyl ester synthase n=1 Tax=Botryobasidium botryosum (strain FD-172 SS1) TaxID=930990 RepID=A0A067MBE6_BOTB1|nr:hypothetical protein BOTBODRAFT_135180 [Botryobasidium botryosum FD-172 SS1]
MFYLVGLGLCDEKDITLRGLEVVKSATRVYLEAYTSILMVNKDRLEEFYGRELILADRDMVETESDAILAGSDSADVALLVVGDPFGATTHADILLRARALNIPFRIIHNASIMNAVGACGLQLYNFGQTVSIPFWTETWKPDSWLARIVENMEKGMHTLVLLDIKVKEQNEENLARGRKIYEPPRYMSPQTAISQIISALLSSPSPLMSPATTLAVTLSRVGGTAQKILSGSLEELAALGEADFGDPLHSMVIVGSRLHPMEIDYAGEFAVGEGWRKVARDVHGVVGEEGV